MGWFSTNMMPPVLTNSASAGNVVYIGSSNEVRRRLREHLADARIKQKAERYRVEYTPDYQRRERALYDQFVLANGGKTPLYNAARP